MWDQTDTSQKVRFKIEMVYADYLEETYKA